MLHIFSYISNKLLPHDHQLYLTLNPKDLGLGSSLPTYEPMTMEKLLKLLNHILLIWITI